MLLRKSDRSHLHRKNTALKLEGVDSHDPTSTYYAIRPPSTQLNSFVSFWARHYLFFFIDTGWPSFLRIASSSGAISLSHLRFPPTSCHTAILSYSHTVILSPFLFLPVTDFTLFSCLRPARLSFSHTAQFVRIGEHRSQRTWASPNSKRDAAPPGPLYLFIPYLVLYATSDSTMPSIGLGESIPPDTAHVSLFSSINFFIAVYYGVISCRGV